MPLTVHLMIKVIPDISLNIKAYIDVIKYVHTYITSNVHLIECSFNTSKCSFNRKILPDISLNIKLQGTYIDVIKYVH